MLGSELFAGRLPQLMSDAGIVTRFKLGAYASPIRAMLVQPSPKIRFDGLPFAVQISLVNVGSPPVNSIVVGGSINI
jgi:hypothetical protein